MHGFHGKHAGEEVPKPSTSPFSSRFRQRLYCGQLPGAHSIPSLSSWATGTEDVTQPEPRCAPQLVTDLPEVGCSGVRHGYPAFRAGDSVCGVDRQTMCTDAVKAKGRVAS